MRATHCAELSKPDVLFVDIEMPDIDGFDLIEAVGKLADTAPLIVFVTAFPKFALDAFDTGAIDFVTKPVRFDRLSASVGRVRAAVQSRLARERLNELVEQLDELRNSPRGRQHAGAPVSLGQSARRACPAGSRSLGPGVRRRRVCPPVHQRA